VELQQLFVQGVVSLARYDEDLILSGTESQVRVQTADMQQSLSETQHTNNLLLSAESLLFVCHFRPVSLQLFVADICAIYQQGITNEIQICIYDK